MFSWLKKQTSTDSVENVTNAEDKVFEHVIALIEDGYNIFITGGAGVGKSYTLNKIKEKYKEKLHITSTTGISAINVNGQTIHSWAGIGLADKPIDEVVKKIRRKATLYKTLLCCEMLAIDEISMLDSSTFTYINEVLKAVRENDKPFGGIQVLIFGDFFQLPPVRMEEDGKDFCFNSQTWKELNLKAVILKDVKRQSEKELSEALNNVRIDKTSAEDLKVFYKRDVEPDYEAPKDILQIFGTNADADAYNDKCFKEIPERPYIYEAKDELYIYNDIGESSVTVLNTKDIANTKVSKYDLMALKKFNEDCKAPEKLELKEGCRVMLLKNIDVKRGLANGSCGTIKQLTSGSIDILFDNGVRANMLPVEFEYIKEGRTKIKRTQYPLRLAYGITIHKSQGMTFDKLVVNFNRIFDYGQAYVALSRTKTLEGLIIRGFDHNKIIANKKVVDFYKQLESEEE